MRKRTKGWLTLCVMLAMAVLVGCGGGGSAGGSGETGQGDGSGDTQDPGSPDSGADSDSSKWGELIWDEAPWG